MPVSRNQSHIADARDQMSLDFASGKYLNIVSSNLGINRPVFGFDDDTWRAVVKELAVEYKQVATKYHDVLSVLFGPQITEVGTLAENAVAGTRIIHLNSTDQFPQKGQVVLDEGLAAEETLDYVLIDRKNDIMFLRTPLTQDHEARTFDAESPIFLVDSLHTSIVLANTSKFPTSDYPYPVVLGRGTTAEEVVLVTDNDVDTGTLTTLTAPQNDHNPLKSTVLYSELAQEYRTASTYLVLDDTKKWPKTGVVLLDAVDSFTVTSSSSLESLEVSSNTFTEDRQVGHVVVFDGNVTSALAGVEAEIVANTDSTLNFWDQLPAMPAASDTFKIRVRVEYLRNNYDDSVLVLRRSIDDLEIPSATKVELLQTVETSALAPVKVAGASWDVIQSTPKLVELFLPEDLRSPSTIRSSSFLHTVEQSPTPTTTISSVFSLSEDSIEVSVSSTTDFPTVGVVTIDSGGSSEERVAYYVKDSTTIVLPYGADNSHSFGESVDYYQPVHSGTDILVGDYQNTDDTFPGPYVYNPELEAPTGTVAATEIDINNILPSPTRLVIGQVIGKTALEAENALSHIFTTFPAVLRVGLSTGNVEEINVNDINLRQRVTPTVATAVSVGDTEIEVSSLSGGGGAAAADVLPDADGYRILVGDEVCYVTGTATSPDRVVLEEGVTEAHSVGTEIRLLADVLTVDPISRPHFGYVSRTQRSTALAGDAGRWPVISSSDQEGAESVHIELSEFDVTDATGLDPTGGRIIINFGNSMAEQKTTLDSSATAGDTTIFCVETDDFPDAAVIFIARGTRKQEIVTGLNDRAADEFKLNSGAYGLLFDHDVGTPVEAFPGNPEVLTYASISGNTISFSPSIVLDSGHVTEPVIAANADSEPQDGGYGYPLRLPTDIKLQLDFLFDLIRAAGVQVKVITQR